jgi:hypothetical protein
MHVHDVPRKERLPRKVDASPTSGQSRRSDSRGPTRVRSRETSEEVVLERVGAIRPARVVDETDGSPESRGSAVAPFPTTSLRPPTEALSR